jgi:peptidylamidoglycolate lyase
LQFLPGSTKPSVVLGKKFESGSDKTHFCRPTDVAVATNGAFFVSDGYCNKRVIKFDADGRFVREYVYGEFMAASSQRKFSS